MLNFIHRELGNLSENLGNQFNFQLEKNIYYIL